MVAISDELVQDVGDESGRLGLVEADTASEALLGERTCDVEGVELVELTREEVEPHCACSIRFCVRVKAMRENREGQPSAARISAGSTAWLAQL